MGAVTNRLARIARRVERYAASLNRTQEDVIAKLKEKFDFEKYEVADFQGHIVAADFRGSKDRGTFLVRRDGRVWHLRLAAPVKLAKLPEAILEDPEQNKALWRDIRAIAKDMSYLEAKRFDSDYDADSEEGVEKLEKAAADGVEKLARKYGKYLPGLKPYALQTFKETVLDYIWEEYQNL